MGEERIITAEDVLRHAVDAAEVAAVGDRDPQVVEPPAEAIRKIDWIPRRAERGIFCKRRESVRRDGLCSASVGERNDLGHGGCRVHVAGHEARPLPPAIGSTQFYQRGTWCNID